MGVLSLMARTSKPAVASARMADSRPDPGPLTRTSTARRPTSLAFEAAVIDACCAAKGVPLRDPRNPREPALDRRQPEPPAGLEKEQSRPRRRTNGVPSLSRSGELDRGRAPDGLGQ